MSPLDVLLIVAGVGYILTRRVIGELLEVKGLLLVPVLLTVIGFSQLREITPVSAATVVFAGLGVLLSVGLGVLRGRTVHLGARNGELWMRYRASSVLLWVVNLAAKGAMIPVERAISLSSADAADRTILLSIGLGILAETAVIVLRAMRSDAAVVWAKGEDGAPHQVSPAFEQARSWVNGTGTDRPLTVAAKRWPQLDRDW